MCRRHGWPPELANRQVLRRIDPHRAIIAIAMTQVSDFLWNGGLNEFEQLVAAL